MQLDQYLNENGLTHAAFAERIGVRQPTVTRFLQGKRGFSDRLKRRVVNATGGAVSLEDLIRDESAAHEDHHS